jgi:hypothetical protein
MMLPIASHEDQTKSGAEKKVKTSSGPEFEYPPFAKNAKDGPPDGSV